MVSTWEPTPPFGSSFNMALLFLYSSEFALAMFFAVTSILVPNALSAPTLFPIEPTIIFLLLTRNSALLKLFWFRASFSQNLHIEYRLFLGKL
jgi:hypothetical protein